MMYLDKLCSQKKDICCILQQKIYNIPINRNILYDTVHNVSVAKSSIPVLLSEIRDVIIPKKIKRSCSKMKQIVIYRVAAGCKL